MKFINPKGVEFEYLESFSEVKRDSFPFGSIYEKEDLTGSKLVLDEEIPIENVFTLKVNVKRVGKVFFLFKLESLDKERLVEEVRKLKSIEVTEFTDAFKKLDSLYESVKPFNPLLAIYYPEGSLKLSKQELPSSTKDLLSFYVLPKTVFSIKPAIEKVKTLFAKKEAKPKEEKSKPVKVKERPKNEHIDEKKNKFRFSNPITILKENSIHFLFAFVGTFLIGFTISIGIFDALLGKAICAFFFVCTAVGVFLNFLIYKDTLAEYKPNSMFFLTTATISLTGSIFSIIIYVIFVNITLEKPAVMPNAFLIVLAIFGAAILSIAVSFLYNFISRDNRK